MATDPRARRRQKRRRRKKLRRWEKKRTVRHVMRLLEDAMKPGAARFLASNVKDLGNGKFAYYPVEPIPFILVRFRITRGAE